MKIEEHQLNREQTSQPISLSVDDFSLDNEGNLVVNQEKLFQLMNCQDTSLQKQLLKGGVSPL